MSNESPGGDLPGSEKPPERMPMPGSELPGAPMPGAAMPGAGMPPEGMPMQEKSSGMAIASLILSIAGLFCGITAIVGIVLGVVELGRIKRGESSEKGRSLALAGVIVGAVVLALGIIFTVISALLGDFSTEIST